MEEAPSGSLMAVEGLGWPCLFVGGVAETDMVEARPCLADPSLAETLAVLDWSDGLISAGATDWPLEASLTVAKALSVGVCDVAWVGGDMGG